MEPSHLDSAPPRDEALDELLKMAACEGLPDNGFSDRVLQALPRPKRTFPLRRWALGVAGGAAGLTAALLSGARPFNLLDLGNQAASAASQLSAALSGQMATNPWPIAILILGLSLAFVAWQSGQTEDSFF